ncbi:MAG: metalloprotease TldD [Alphaproteobacteria bacterium]|nr:MAG: metalloprotease TldD [Alphaproteobacteria bacterium]
MTSTPADASFAVLNGLDVDSARQSVSEALNGADDGELFVECAASESLVWDDGHLRSASFRQHRGMALRALAGEACVLAHGSEVGHEALDRAGQTVRQALAGRNGVWDSTPIQAAGPCVAEAGDPLREGTMPQRLALLAEMDGLLRARDPRVRQVSLSWNAEIQDVAILRPDGQIVTDHRPLVRAGVNVVLRQGERQESGSGNAGGRGGFDSWLSMDSWQVLMDEALLNASRALESIPAPAGEMTVVLGPGWPGVLLHEAVGHGLEGDFNRRGSSAFAGMVGQRVAAPGVTVVDDGSLPGRRGSLTVDDEGTPTQRTVLIEDGILKGYLQDRLNGRLTGVASTGNGRRQNYACRTMPRMTNTFMLSGVHDPAEIIASVPNGIYATHFGGGQVDITSGQFVFDATQAFLIENGRIGAPLKGVSLIGAGSRVLQRISMIGHDSQMDPGIGFCGKEGQTVPVGVGLPTIRLDGITVGGQKF